MADDDRNDDEEEALKDLKEEERKEQAPLMQLLEWKFLLGLPDNLVSPNEKNDLKTKALTRIQDNHGAALYKQFTSAFHWEFNETQFNSLQAEADSELKTAEAKIEEAKKNAGETEVREAKVAKADLLARIGEKEKAYAAYKDALEISVGSGSRIDVVFSEIRVALFHNDLEKVKEFVAQAKAFVADGGDWERRNLLKIYEAIYLILTREFAKAATLFLDSIANFTCYELFSYNKFIFYCVLTCVVAVDRNTLTTKVVRQPEILSSYREVPFLEAFLTSIYKSKYHEFFKALADIADQIQRDPFFSPHIVYIIRELRVVAYRQFLQSYRSVKLESMAESFGISAPFLDAELSKFISANRLNCKIDKVHGIVETNRPDNKNAQYQQVIKQGDLLLGRIQKLTKSISG